MGFSDAERRNIDTKILQGSVFDANSTGVWFESRLLSGKMIDSRQVLVQADILEANPASNISEARTNAAGPLTGIIADVSLPTNSIHLTSVPGTNASTYVALSGYNDWSSPRIKNWIQPQMIPQANGAASIGYAVRLYNGDPNGAGTEILTTDGTSGLGINKTVGWIFNYDNGELILSDDFKSNVTDPYIMGFYYIGETAGSGGSIDVCNKTTKTKIQLGSNLTVDNSGERYIKMPFVMFTGGDFVKVYEDGVLLTKGTDWVFGIVLAGTVSDLIDNVRILNPNMSSTYQLEYTECQNPYKMSLKMYRRDGQLAKNRAITPRMSMEGDTQPLHFLFDGFDYEDTNEMIYAAKYVCPLEPHYDTTTMKLFSNHAMFSEFAENLPLDPWRIEVWKTGLRRSSGTVSDSTGRNTNLVPYGIYDANRIEISGRNWGDSGRFFRFTMRNTVTNEIMDFSDRLLEVAKRSIWLPGNNGDEFIASYYRTKVL